MAKFLWGAATSSYQIEGAYSDDNKALGIWDNCAKHVVQDQDGKVACDHYHRYREDIACMKKIGLNSYRFSVAWGRIITDEKGSVNDKGLRFYCELADELNKNGIEPLCTLYHWDLPIWAHELGGWKNEKISEWFAHYVDVLTKALRGKVKYFITFNEPQNFVGRGYLAGMHAPFERNDLNTVKNITRNILLSHGRAVKIIRKNIGNAIIGIASASSICTPETIGEVGLEEARRKSFDDAMGIMGSTWWCDPMMLGIEPECLRGLLSKNDLEEINQPLDFFGFNCYSAMNYAGLTGKRNNPIKGFPRTTMGWAVTPEVLYYAPKFYYERYKLPVMVTENGMANCDWVMSDGKIHDTQRIDYMHRYIKELLRAKKEGIPVIGYQHWSLMDNFEWAEGYEKRFGLIYIDFTTQQRILKDSAYFYSEIIKANGENL